MCHTIEVPQVNHEKLNGDRLGLPSRAMHARVEAARAYQRERFARVVQMFQ